MPDDLFSSDELTQLKEITELYSITKTLILYSEEINNLESFVPPINEIKDSHDHLMRVLSVKFGLNEGMPTDYTKKNIDKVFSHLYRAAFESLDYIRICQKDAISEKLRDVSNDALVGVFPEYYNIIRPRLEVLIEQIPTYKKDKDIGKPDLEALRKYNSTILEIKEHIKVIESKRASLIDFDVRRRAEKTADDRKMFIYMTISGVIGAVIGALIVGFL